jgi:uncharacterized membrane protein YgdD (TMEM256/DUF423 family)
MTNRFVFLGAVAGALGVAGGAFGAHALRTRLSAEALGWFETAARYQMLHALALVASGLATGQVRDPHRSVAGTCFAAGIVLFSGSLYAMACTGWRGLGVITPFGGTAWIAGWIALAVGSVHGRRAA